MSGCGRLVLSFPFRLHSLFFDDSEIHAQDLRRRRRSYRPSPHPTPSPPPTNTIPMTNPQLQVHVRLRPLLGFEGRRRVGRWIGHLQLGRRWGCGHRQLRSSPWQGRRGLPRRRRREGVLLAVAKGHGSDEDERWRQGRKEGLRRRSRSVLQKETEWEGESRPARFERRRGSSAGRDHRRAVAGEVGVDDS